MGGDILDTCEDKSGEITRLSVPKLNKKFCSTFYLLQPAFLLAVVLLFSSFHPNKPKPYGITRVVIDAGHGGHDSGCLGKKTKEKDVALGIALKLGNYIKDKFPDVKVIYTRDDDQFVELHQRATIANNARADLFICIHCNSACYMKKKKEICNEETSGVETWVMGLHKTEANLEVSKRENEVVLLEKDYTRQYDGFDPNSPEANIIFSLYQNTFLDQSLKLASFVQQEVKNKGRKVRGVKQAGFLVLYKTSMPSILIETGFLSNPEEEKYLGSEKGQDEIASGIFKAFKLYKSSVETGVKSGDSGSSATMRESGIGYQCNGIEWRDANKTTIGAGDEEDSDETPGKKVSDLVWSVQFYSSPEKISKTSPKFKGITEIREDKDGKVYKYSAGNLGSVSDAVELQNKIRKKGFKDAFVVAFYKDKKISYKEAMEISGEEVML
ncbi:MAG: N-acetylmuramoyl-L-alanine amidase [Bacteroidetes bacterium]|nr:N-acetylmuramoyl-L-alanine amidase [Bacteroidota bacterium]